MENLEKKEEKTFIDDLKINHLKPSEKRDYDEILEKVAEDAIAFRKRIGSEGKEKKKLT
ncbi:MAG: hypothetical protein ACFFCS_12615 [Candidatus Hodarchaeota archaeon]